MDKFLDSYKAYWANWKDFDGKTDKGDFWRAVAVLFVLGIVVGFISRIPVLGQLVYYAYLIINLVPGLAMGWRRMHDTGRAGWWYLIPIVNLIFALGDSKTDALAK
ncbi:MAG: DUF805 domain-containing protein [Oscillospiraceae bacterium]|nr:DUF805 domain-containing protein [Oscillospiraceae bacterium]